MKWIGAFFRAWARARQGSAGAGVGHEWEADVGAVRRGRRPGDRGPALRPDLVYRRARTVAIGAGALLALVGATPAQAASIDHSDKNKHGGHSAQHAIKLPTDLCLAIERGYKNQHPERTDLQVGDGTDCTGVATMTVVPEPVPATAAPGDPCSGYWESVPMNAWGFIQVGYQTLNIGACYDNLGTVWRNWGPNASMVFYPPNMRGWAYNTGYYGDWSSQLTTYSNYDGQYWQPPFGWCCDRYWWLQYSIDGYGDWWWS